MSCRHDLALGNCRECYPNTGTITPHWPGDSMDGPGAVSAEVARCFKVGFSGTRQGMSKGQKKAFERLLSAVPLISQFHHGDCVGADAEAQAIVKSLTCQSPIQIHSHPPTVDALAAHTVADYVWWKQDYRIRNQQIVDECRIMIFAPAPGPRTGGTWSTYKYAKKQGDRVLYLIKPNGTITLEFT